MHNLTNSSQTADGCDPLQVRWMWVKIGNNVGEALSRDMVGVVAEELILEARTKCGCVNLVTH